MKYGGPQTSLPTTIMQTVTYRKQGLILLLMVMTATLGFYYFRVNQEFNFTINTNTAKSGATLTLPAKFAVKLDGYTVWSAYESKEKYSHSWYVRHCFNGRFKQMSISKIKELDVQWSKSQNAVCRSLYRKFRDIFSIVQRSGTLELPKPFLEKVRKWLGNDEDLVQETRHQTITLIFNEYTHDHTIFNPLRSKRPVNKPAIPERVYVEQLSKEAKKSCDFCNYKNFTAKDKEGRIEGKFSYTAANTFKYDAWHELFITQRHHPLNWTKEELLDVFDVAQKWLTRVHSLTPTYTFPVILWDLLPHASASQVHPHLHGNLINNRYYGAMENWRLGAQRYYQLHGTNYFTDLTEIHTALGLAARHQGAVAMANVNPKKDHEVIVMSKTANKDFFELLYFVLRAYIDDMDQLCFSMGMALPQIGVIEPEGDIPAYVRVITRGSVTEIRSDISSLELFAASNVNRDPYEVIKTVRASIEKRRTQEKKPTSVTT